jgi:hypothetical protein
MQNPGGGQGAILLEGRERIRFGTGLNEKRRCFVLNALKYLRAASRRPVDGIGRGETE